MQPDESFLTPFSVFLFAVGAVTIFCSAFITDWLDFLPLPSSMNPQEPPWYFIAADFRKFLAHVIGLSLIFILFLSFYKKHKAEVLFSSCFAIIFFGGAIGKGLSILAHTGNLFNPGLATTSWQTFESYLHDPWMIVGSYLPLLLGFVLIILWRKRFRQELTDREE